MYLGGVDASGVWLCSRELLDNGLDEHLAGRNDGVHLHVDTDGSYWVTDNGQGVPQGTKKFTTVVNGKEVPNTMPTMQAVFGEMHTSGKYRSEAYAVSVGCFTGDTIVHLGDGDGPPHTMDTLYKHWQERQQPICSMAWDTQSDGITFSEISHIQLSKYTRDLVRVTLQSGDKITCTPDHPFFVRKELGLTKVEAKDLLPGTRLISTCEHFFPHSVASVEPFLTEEPVPVYGLTMDTYHSYFVGPGVLVANTHGVGAKGTNATSEFFDVFTNYKGKWYTVGFKKGLLTTPVKECKAPSGPDGKRVQKGTVIHFKPDATIFTAKSFPASMAIEWAEIMSYLNPGFSITISSAKGRKVFLSKKGPTEYVETRMIKLRAEGERVMFDHRSDLADVVVAFSNYDGCDVRGFTNGLNNAQGGKHVDSITGALYAGLKPFIKVKKVQGKPVPAFREADLKEGLVGLVNAKLHKAQFSSQDKAKLTDDRVGKDFEIELTKVTTKFFKDNKALAQRIADRATKMNELKTQFTMSKKAAADLNKVKRLGLPAKYAAYDPKTKIHDRELFLTEGDSATGKLKEAREAYQAISPLRGKILIVLKPTKKKTPLYSEEVINILAAIGYDPKAADPYSKLTIGKIICLADPDPDGPFIGDTKIRIQVPEWTPENSDKVWESELRIDSLVTEVQRKGAKFEVPVWSGAKEIWAPATAELVRNVDTLVALEIAGTKYKVSEDHKFLCHANTNAMKGRETIESPFNDLVYVAAKNLHIGDRVFLPALNGSRKPAEADKGTKLGYAPVSKMRIQKLSEPVPVYCLTVTGFHNFILPSGIVSSNCHINSLLLALFYKYLPDLFKRGMVYVSAIPEFYSIHKGQLVTGDTVSVMKNKLTKLKAPASVQVNHLKGWGEAPKNLLKILACDPSTRRLIRISAIEKEDTVEFVKLMDEDVSFRRKMFGLPSSVKTIEEPTTNTAPIKRKAA